jgi:4-hydroxybenzoate polyprenyltransferase
VIRFDPRHFMVFPVARPIWAKHAERMGRTHADVALVAMARELSLSWGFVRYDITSTVVPATLAMVAAARIDPSVSPTTLVLGIAYFLLYVYVFSVSNQIVGVEEDRRNKPDRPLPSGAVTLRGAWIRWALAMVLFPMLGAALGVARWALLWQLSLSLYNFGGFARHWATKSLIMAVGLVAQLAAAWAIVGPVPELAWRWIAGLAVVAFVLCNVQDLRDVAGDRVLRRRTLPIVYGLRPTCLALAVLFALGLPVLTHGWLFDPLPHGGLVWVSLLLLDGLGLVIAARLVLDHQPAGLHRTYMLFTYWYCLALACACVVLPCALADGGLTQR